MSKTEHVLLGSGDLYLVDFSGEIPEEDETIECPQKIFRPGGSKGKLKKPEQISAPVF